MSALISMSDLYGKLKQKSLTTIDDIDDNNNSNNSDSVKHNQVFEHNLHVLIELCNEKLNITNNTNSDGYETNETVANNYVKKVRIDGQYRYRCVFNDDCNMHYSQRHNCMDHINAAHTGEKRYKCGANNCDFKSAYKRCLKVHTDRNHPQCEQMSGKSKLCCDWDSCEFNTAFKSLLTVHKRTHTLPFKCIQNKCGYKTAYEHNLKRHMKQFHPMKRIYGHNHCLNTRYTSIAFRK